MVYAGGNMSIEKGGHQPQSPETTRDNQPTSPEVEMGQAKEFFQTRFQLHFDEEGFIIETSADQIRQLAEWRKEVGVMPETPTIESFYQKTLLAASLWRQESEGKINYLFGKGAGVEIALLGEVEGRKKNNASVSYRPHSDFELYAVEYNADENGANQGGIEVYTDEFVEVFGPQEYLPTTRTKALEDLPADLLHMTSERVNLAGVTLLVPQLEILFLDKWQSRETTPRPEGYDDEVLAKEYDLDAMLLHDYLQRFVIEPSLKRMKKEREEFEERHFEAISGHYRAYKYDIQALNAELAMFSNRDVRYGGIGVKYWIPLERNQIDADGNITDKALRATITKKITEDFDRIQQDTVGLHQKLGQYLTDLKKDA